MGRISKKEQVMNAIGGWISSGRYKAGMQLPTVNQPPNVPGPIRRRNSSG